MKNLFIILALLIPGFVCAQFSQMEKSGISIIVTDGTFDSTHSPQRPPGDAKYQDPIRSLGMVDAIQAGAFTVRPRFGTTGYLLVFCVNDSVGGKQGTLEMDGNTYYGIYRLIRQKISAEEEVPEGMTSYRLKGTVFFLGISQVIYIDEFKNPKVYALGFLNINKEFCQIMFSFMVLC